MIAKIIDISLGGTLDKKRAEGTDKGEIKEGFFHDIEYIIFDYYLINYCFPGIVCRRSVIILTIEDKSDYQGKRTFFFEMIHFSL